MAVLWYSTGKKCRRLTLVFTAEFNEISQSKIWIEPYLRRNGMEANLQTNIATYLEYYSSDFDTVFTIGFVIYWGFLDKFQVYF